MKLHAFDSPGDTDHLRRGMLGCRRPAADRQQQVVASGNPVATTGTVKSTRSNLNAIQCHDLQLVHRTN